MSIGSNNDKIKQNNYQVRKKKFVRVYCLIDFIFPFFLGKETHER